jgi:hypothetical protein
MDDRTDTSGPSGPSERPGLGPTVLITYPPEHTTALAVVERLTSLGCTVLTAASIYEAVMAIAREPARFAAAILAVDYANREELRFFPLAKRRWPALKTIALSQEGFAYKAAVADLAGADLVCTDPARADAVIALLGLEKPSQGRAIQEEEPAAPQPAGMDFSNDKSQEEPPSWVRPRAAEPPPEAPPVERKPPASPVAKPPTVKPPFSARDVLTEEEIKALMQDMDDEDLPRGTVLKDLPDGPDSNERRNGTDHG